MCGILGYFGSNVDGFSKRETLKTLIHRGPDNLGDIKGEQFYLGQTRLSIIELSEKGNQPMISKDGRYILIFNGEIYNHIDLRDNLLNKVV